MLYHLYAVYASTGTKSPDLSNARTRSTFDPPTTHHDLRLCPRPLELHRLNTERASRHSCRLATHSGISTGLSTRAVVGGQVHVIKIPEETHVWGLAHNDPAWARETARSYVYSEADSLVHYRDVEVHADDAEAKGFVVVRRQKFVGSRHVAHARRYPDEYWGLVRETWEGGC